jgi:hypothetical protein
MRAPISSIIQIAIHLQSDSNHHITKASASQIRHWYTGLEKVAAKIVEKTTSIQLVIVILSPHMPRILGPSHAENPDSPVGRLSSLTHIITRPSPILEMVERNGSGEIVALEQMWKALAA